MANDTPLATAADAFDPAWRTIVNMARTSNDSDYGEFVSSWPLRYYRARLEQIGFSGFGRVLDVGCGHGHWLAALATLNAKVDGIDVHNKRVEIANALLRDLWLDNAEASVASALSLPFDDNTFDAVFCYGVFMFLDEHAALTEFKRVAKPGAPLYVCTNGPGWWLKLCIERFRSNRRLSMIGLRAYLGLRGPGIPSSLTLPRGIALLHSKGFALPRAAAEGQLTSSSIKSELEPHYKAKHLGHDNVIELMAIKPTTNKRFISDRSHKRDIAFRHIEKALASTHYSYRQSLQQYPSADPGELTFATNEAAASVAMTCAEDIDRAEFLREVATMATAHLNATERKVRACLLLAQKLFYHHFAVQPMKGTQHLVDPVEVSIFRACRCGNSARFVVDLLEVLQIPARLISGACHTASEVFIDGQWRLLDPSLYPPGIVLEDEDGRLLPTERALLNHKILDAPPSYINYESGHIRCFSKLYPSNAELLRNFLDFPIFPSCGYFGKDLTEPRRMGRLERYTKIPRSTKGGWLDWSSVELQEWILCPQLPTLQRPQQVQDIRCEVGKLTWSPAKTRAATSSVSYDVFISETPRMWQYDAIPVGCDFAVPGQRFNSAECNLQLDESLRGRRFYVSIIARLAPAEDAFHLPSEEFSFEWM